MTGGHRKFLLLCAIMAALVALTGSQGLAADGGDPGSGAVIGTATAQRFADGPNGTVFTLTTFRTEERGEVTVSTHGGVRSDGIGQFTSHEASFEVGRTYRMNLSEAIENGPTVDGSTSLFRVAGGDRGAMEVTIDGEAIDQSHSTPGNFVLQPFNWRWTLPDNPPVFYVNPNAPDNIDEVTLVRQGFDTWENDPGSSMDWSYGGTTTIGVTANDGTNVVYWADTPDPADTFLARSTTFYSTATGNAVDTNIQFNNDYNWVDGAASGAFDTVSVAIHESGHSLGLDHAPDDAAIMYFSIRGGAVKRMLSLGDRGGVAALYPRTVESTVTGTVAFDNGTALAGGGVDLFTENRQAWIEATGTDDAGQYSFSLPGAGCYVLTFIAPDGERFTNGRQYLNVPFCAGAGEAVTGVDATLVSAANATTATGRVVADGGEPVQGVAVDLFTENRGAWLSSTVTDGGGNHELALPGAGCYVATFIAPEGRTFINGGGFLNAPFCAQAGETVTGIDAELIGQSAGSSIGDSVTNADGSGAPDAEVALYEANGDGSRGRYLRSERPASDGSYLMTVAPGCYVIDLVAPSGQTWAATGGPYLQYATCLAGGESDLGIDGVLN